MAADSAAIAVVVANFRREILRLGSSLIAIPPLRRSIAHMIRET
jgi:hypothetical protein